MASAIAASLQLKPGLTGATRHVPNEQAHELYLRAAYEMQNVTPASLAKAAAALQQCVKLDPDYAAAWFALGLAKFNESVADGRSRTPAELAEAQELYRKALNLDPDLSAAHANLGLIAMVYNWDWTAAKRELQSSSRNGLNAPAEINYGLLLSYRDNFSRPTVTLSSRVLILRTHWFSFTRAPSATGKAGSPRPSRSCNRCSNAIRINSIRNSC